MTTEQLAALKEVAEKALDANLNAPNWFEYQAAVENFRAEWTPAKCKALLEEVERLTAEIEFWQSENVKSHHLGATMAGLLTDAQQEELNRLRREMQSSSLGDRPSSISADKLRRLIHLESQAKGQS